MEDRHISYTEKRYIYTDLDGVDHHTDERPVYCGDWVGGRKEICDTCLPQMNEKYPQGWRYYPGDVCIHGTYVGGCGIDWICQPCEDGLDKWVDDPRFEFLITTADGKTIHTTLEWRLSDLQPGTDRWTLRRLARMNRMLRVMTDELHWTIHVERRDSGYWAAA